MGTSCMTALHEALNDKGMPGGWYKLQVRQSGSENCGLCLTSCGSDSTRSGIITAACFGTGPTPSSSPMMAARQQAWRIYARAQPEVNRHKRRLGSPGTDLHRTRLLPECGDHGQFWWLRLLDRAADAAVIRGLHGLCRILSSGVAGPQLHALRKGLQKCRIQRRAGLGSGGGCWRGDLQVPVVAPRAQVQQGLQAGGLQPYACSGRAPPQLARTGIAAAAAAAACEPWCYVRPSCMVGP